MFETNMDMAANVWCLFRLKRGVNGCHPWKMFVIYDSCRRMFEDMCANFGKDWHLVWLSAPCGKKSLRKRETCRLGAQRGKFSSNWLPHRGKNG